MRTAHTGHAASSPHGHRWAASKEDEFPPGGGEPATATSLLLTPISADHPRAAPTQIPPSCLCPIGSPAGDAHGSYIYYRRKCWEMGLCLLRGRGLRAKEQRALELFLIDMYTNMHTHMQAHTHDYVCMCMCSHMHTHICDPCPRVITNPCMPHALTHACT